MSLGMALKCTKFSARIHKILCTTVPVRGHLFTLDEVFTMVGYDMANDRRW
jgi:hypothetical protein